MRGTVTIAVRPLVEYALRSGDLASGFRQTASMADGVKAHQQVQEAYGERDRSEVQLRAEILWGELLFAIEGRCDGLLTGEDGGVTIEEIKSTGGSLPLLEAETPEVHWAQAYCYAYMYANAEGLDRIRVKMTYVETGGEGAARRSFERTAEFVELERRIRSYVESYAPLAELQLRHRAARDASIAGLVFPYPAYRTGQRKLAAAVYRSIEAGHQLFARAPTGIGKTMSTLYPAVKSIGEGRLSRLFYLTARTTTRASAEDALRRLQDGGLQMHAVTITAKDKLCSAAAEQAGGGGCAGGLCMYAEGFFDRINGAILDLLSNETLIGKDELLRYAAKHRVCPFEMSLEAAYVADAVICDYNYIFDPRISLKRVAAEWKASCALLVDEAHNLPDRAREMYSAELTKRDFLNLVRAFKGKDNAVRAAAKSVDAALLAIRKRDEEQGAFLVLPEGLPEALNEAVEAFAEAAETALAGRERSAAGADDALRAWETLAIPSSGAVNSVVAADTSADAGDGPTAEADPYALLLEAYFAAVHWMRIVKLYDEERHIVYAERQRGDVRIKLFCMDPSRLLRQMRKGYRSQICFSATLFPLGYYMDLIGAEETDYSVSVPSPFRAEQWETEVVPLSTRYADREASRGRIASRLLDLISGRPGRYLYFFPSYAYLNAVYETFLEQGGGVWRTMAQRPDMTEEERGAYLSAFEAEEGATLIGFAVLGGVFSEGIDLAGDRLQGVAIVGVGMPQPSFERDLMRTHYDEAGLPGFDYAYVYPGMNKVLQAGGRLIRTESDRGVLVLIDDRYRRSPYRRLLPEEWGADGGGPTEKSAGERKGSGSADPSF
ncbi:ATP-dependent DNA helicase [Cohnella hashimotonis]|uniref:ATP-dependent DNA helicase n=1 Tax=Cohnella hashimotonis TaxID=2826895 RepID=A0ABT6TT73_9BACL|nr:ATP-dependent DNA helicase [Cohnella hashimotonis]MDI4650059.1 ATP-dependent DNA helicase [Cohnella hashimotonis]